MTSTLSPPAAASAERPRQVSLSYLPGLDGLRAISVVAVLLYHGRDVGIDWLPEGGFLGVEVFFVISRLPHHRPAARRVPQPGQPRPGMVAST